MIVRKGSPLYKERMRIQENRANYAKRKLSEKGIRFQVAESNEDSDDILIKIDYKNGTVDYYPYTGYHTGPGIEDGRGISNLIKQLT